jgi:hypothetical protein
MNNKNTGARLTYLMTFAVLAGFAIILIMNAAAFLGVVPSGYLSPNDVRGIAVEHDQKLYTLNFEQQKDLIDIINRFIPVGHELVEKRKVEVEHPPEVKKIIIYRFHGPDLELVPVAFVSKSTSVISNVDESTISIVFSVPEWNKNGLLEESTGDDLTKFLSSTYGP